MSDTDFKAFKGLFIQTARGHLQDIASALRILHSDPDDQEAVYAAYIGLHSLKGECFALGYMSTGTLCQTIEKLFQRMRDHTLTLTPLLLTAITFALARLDESVASIQTEDKELVLSDALMKLEKEMKTKVGG